jgi:hypothetical protein
VRFIWATRGRTWGFRFLTTGGFIDPLPEYDRAFSSIEEGPAVFHHLGETITLRFPDPLCRTDISGRTIPHDFVIFDQLASTASSVEEGRNLVWPLVEELYCSVWDCAEPQRFVEGDVVVSEEPDSIQPVQ